MAGIPEMNLDAEGKSFKSSEELHEPTDVASVLGNFFATESDTAGGKGSDVVLNLENCLISSQAALGVVKYVANHSPAYGNSLEDADAKALETFNSMHGGTSEEDAQGCTWYGSTDPDILPNTFPEFFATGENEHWQDWIGFFLVCVREDKRTVSYIVGADTD